MFNVDIREPILRQSPTVLSGENVEDYFGFAVVLHQVEEVQPGEDMMTVAGKTRYGRSVKTIPQIFACVVCCSFSSALPFVLTK